MAEFGIRWCPVFSCPRTFVQIPPPRRQHPRQSTQASRRRPAGRELAARRPACRSYHRQVERLAAIVEMERAAAAWRTNQPELFGEILAQAVMAQPSYWREPGVILRWFTSSLKMNEFVQWRLSPDMIVFEKQIAEMLSQAENILSTGRHRSLKAAAALALSDLAYGQQDTRIRHRALNAAIRNSWQVCLSPQGRASAARGLLGPILAGKLAAFYRSLRG